MTTLNHRAEPNGRQKELKGGKQMETAAKETKLLTAKVLAETAGAWQPHP